MKDVSFWLWMAAVFLMGFVTGFWPSQWQFWVILLALSLAALAGNFHAEETIRKRLFDRKFQN